MDLAGWEALSSAEQEAARFGGVLGFGTAMAAYALFGFYPTGHRWPRRRKRKKGRR